MGKHVLFLINFPVTSLSQENTFQSLKQCQPFRPHSTIGKAKNPSQKNPQNSNQKIREKKQGKSGRNQGNS